MLIEFEVKMQLPIIGFLNLHCHGFEQFVDVILDKQRMSKDAHDLHNWTANLMVMFDDTHEAICDDGNMYLNSDRILTFTPERLDLEVLFDPFEEQLNLPSVLIKECNFTCFEIEVIGVVSKGSTKIWSIVDNASERNRIVSFVSLPCEANCLVAKNIILSFKEVLAILNFVVRVELLSDNEECSCLFNGKKPGEVKVSTVKYIARKPLILNPVHCINIMNACRGDSVEYRYLCNDVNLCMDSDARLGASECSPSKYSKTEINRGGVNGIESTMKFKLLGDSSLLSLADHIEGELFKYSVISESVGPGYDTPVGSRCSETKMVGTFSMSGNDIYKFAKTGTARELTEYEYTKKVPMCKRPTLRPVVVSTDDAIELAFERRGYLLKHVSPRMHILSNFDLDAKVRISNVGHTLQNLLCCA